MADQSSNATTNARARHEEAVLKAGQAMLIIALVLIFLLVCAVCTYLVFRARKKRRTAKKEVDLDEERGNTETQDSTKKENVANNKHGTMTKRLDNDSSYSKDIVLTQPSHDKKHAAKQHRRHHSRSKSGTVAELPFSPLCEMGESEPRHELADDEVPERYFRDGDGDGKEGWGAEKDGDGDGRYASWRCSRSETLADTSWFDDNESVFEGDGMQKGYVL